MKDTEYKITGDHCQNSLLEIEVEVNAVKYPIYFKSKTSSLQFCEEAMVTGTLLASMFVKNDIDIKGGELSEKLISSLTTIQDIFTTWNKDFNRVVLKNYKPVKREGGSKKKVAAFFSGGVDSFYTLFKHKDEITDIVFIHGFDIPVTNNSLYEKTATVIYKIAEYLGKNVIEVETNLRILIDPFAEWANYGHGIAMATVGHLISSEFKKIYIASSQTYNELLPRGAHPLLDHLYGTESFEFVHDGCEANRVNKVKFISAYDIALKTLRVCWQNPDNAYNCGKCEKCIRTMINLKMVGALDRCTTFDAPFDIAHVYNIRIEGENVRAFIVENLSALEETEGENELKEALRAVLNPAPASPPIEITPTTNPANKKSFLKKLTAKIKL